MIETIEQATAEIFLKPLIFNDEDNDFILNKQYKGIFYKDTNKPEWENKIILLFDNKLIDKSIKLTPGLKQIGRFENIASEMEYFIRSNR